MTPRSLVTQAQMDQMTDLRAEGLSVREIGAAMGLHSSTIVRRLNGTVTKLKASADELRARFAAQRRRKRAARREATRTGGEYLRMQRKADCERRRAAAEVKTADPLLAALLLDPKHPKPVEMAGATIGVVKWLRMDAGA